MSKRYHLTQAHYQADSAPLRADRKRKQEIAKAWKEKEKQERIADQAARVAAEAHSLSVRTELSLHSRLCAEEIERIAEEVGVATAESVRTAMLQSKGKG